MTDADETRHNISESADKINVETLLEQDQPWRDADLVNHLYHEREMSGPEIADTLGCSVRPIYDRIEDARSFGEANKIWQLRQPAQFKTSRDGYERVGTKINGEHHSMAVHRLVVVAEHGIDALCGKVVHHKNGIPWDNRPENLELMDQSDHVREHFEEIPPHEKAAMFALVEASDLRTDEIGKMFDRPQSAVTTVAKRVRDGDYPITEGEA